MKIEGLIGQLIGIALLGIGIGTENMIPMTLGFSLVVLSFASEIKKNEEGIRTLRKT